MWDGVERNESLGAYPWELYLVSGPFLIFLFFSVSQSWGKQFHSTTYSLPWCSASPQFQSAGAKRPWTKILDTMTQNKFSSFSIDFSQAFCHISGNLDLTYLLLWEMFVTKAWDCLKWIFCTWWKWISVKYKARILCDFWRIMENNTLKDWVQ
jgi:hypothetical protein